MPAPQPTVCPDENAISAFADGVASSELRAQIEAHIVTCADCRELLSMLGMPFRKN